MKKQIQKISSPGEPLLKTLFKFGYFIFTKPGLSFVARKSRRLALKAGLIKEHALPYHDWVVAGENPVTLQKEYNSLINTLAAKPRVSIFITLPGPWVSHYSACIASVFSQNYTHWHLYISYPASSEAELSKALANHPAGSVGLFPADAAGMPGAAFTALITQPNGDYVLALGPDSTLAPNCLFELVKHINQNPDDDLVYFDDDTLVAGKYSTPHFKPDWSPQSLLSRNYIGGTFLVRASLVNQINKAGGNYPAAGSYDFLLRVAEGSYKVAHIPKILSHNSAAPVAGDDSKAAIDNALARRGTPGKAIPSPLASGIFNVAYDLVRPGKVSIIIPTKDNVALLKTTLDSVIGLTTYKNYEIILLDNNSSSPEFAELVAEYQTNYPNTFRCIPAHFPFNFSKLINLGVEKSTGDYMLMLNNDVKVIQGDWLEKMMAYAQQPTIGAVGVKLLFPGGNIQHAGIVLGVGEASAHAFINLPNDSPAHFNYIHATNNFSALTAACLMVSKEVYTKVGGMDENLPVEFNDIDFCLKLSKAGFYNVYLPTVTLYHYESATRGHPFKSIASWKQHEKDLGNFKQKWGNLVNRDPFYNINLSSEYTDFKQKKRNKA